AVAIRPALIAKSAHKIVDGIVPGAELKLTGGARWIQGFRIESEAAQQCVRKDEEQEREGKNDSHGGTLHGAQNPNDFALPPGSTPKKSEAANQRTSRRPHDRATRRSKGNSGHGDEKGQK